MFNCHRSRPKPNQSRLSKLSNVFLQTLQFRGDHALNMAAEIIAITYASIVRLIETFDVALPTIYLQFGCHELVAEGSLDYNPAFERSEI